MDIPDKLRIMRYGPAMVNIESVPVDPCEYGQLPYLRQYMIEVMLRFNGVGIAACQVGVFSNFCLVGLANGTILDMVNPEIIEMHGYEPMGFEACLSIPPVGNGCIVPRMEHITVAAGSADAPRNKREYRLSMMEARVAQHEIDHLSGVFFIDRATEKRKKVVLQTYENWRRTQWRPQCSATSPAEHRLSPIG